MPWVTMTATSISREATRSTSKPRQAGNVLTARCITCQDQYAHDPKVIGRWAEEERANTTSRFELKQYNTYTREWDKLMEAKPKERNHKRLAELTEPLVEYINRFFVIALHKKPEVVQLEYDQEGKHISNFVRRSVRSHWDTYTHPFMRAVWYKHNDRREVDRLTFELDPAAVGPASSTCSWD